MLLQPLSTKKTFYYNFFPTKEEEERERERAETREVESGQGGHHGRVLVEIRDLDCFPPPVVDPKNPWVIKKILNQDEVASGKLVLTRHDTFEHVLRYWSFAYVNFVVKGPAVNLAIWDVTQEKNPRKYVKVGDAYMHMVEGDEFHLYCKALMEERDLKVRDEIGLYWDIDRSCFVFKLFLNLV